MRLLQGSTAIISFGTLYLFHRVYLLCILCLYNRAPTVTYTYFSCALEHCPSCCVAYPIYSENLLRGALSRPLVPVTSFSRPLSHNNACNTYIQLIILTISHSIWRIFQVVQQTLKSALCAWRFLCHLLYSLFSTVFICRKNQLEILCMFVTST